MDDCDSGHASPSPNGEIHHGIVKLNIGGHCYCTTASTLTTGRAGTDNFFTSLLSGRHRVLLDGEHYFIDRNGRYFEPLLDYLRTGVWVWPAHMTEEQLLAEARFYGIEPEPYQRLSDRSIVEWRRRHEAAATDTVADGFAAEVALVQDVVTSALKRSLHAGDRVLTSPIFVLGPTEAAFKAFVVDRIALHFNTGEPGTYVVSDDLRPDMYHFVDEKTMQLVETHQRVVLALFRDRLGLSLAAERWHCGVTHNRRSHQKFVYYTGRVVPPGVISVRVGWRFVWSGSEHE